MHRTHMKEAAARIKMNNLLENAGGRSSKGAANIHLEPSVIEAGQARVEADRGLIPRPHLGEG